MKDAEKKDAEKKDEKPKTRKETRRKTFYTAVPMNVTYESLNQETLDKYIKVEVELQKKDQESMARAHAKNAVESAVYNSRDKLAAIWADFSTGAEKEKLSHLLEKTQEWLYEEGDDETKEVYEQKLAEIQALSNPLAKRFHEWTLVPGALVALQEAIAQFRSAATGGEEKYAHLSKEDLEKIVKECAESEDAIKPNLEAFKNRKQTDDPVYLSSDLAHRAQNLSNFCTPILSKLPPPPPKPAPAPAEPASAEPPKDETKMETEPTPATDGKKEGDASMDTTV